MTVQVGSVEPAIDATAVARPTLRGHISIARPDHWVKNVFVLPGLVVALALDPTKTGWNLILPCILGMISVCLVSSSNYTINEMLDAPFDRQHPTKCRRPIPAGRVSIPLGYVQWILLMVVGMALGLMVNLPFAITMGVLWVMGCVYNIPPLRTKDIPYVDVLSESVNNPLRMLAGWYIVRPDVVVPSSALLSYWMVGCYFMAMKRLAEYVEIGDPARAAAYRKSFAFYTRERLLVSIMFYGSAAMLFFGAFIMRYRLELVLSFPLVALVMANYLSLSFKRDSAVQAPEKLYREPTLMASVIACALVMGVLMLVNLPWVNNVFSPGSAAFERLAGVDVNGPAEDGP
ncbi:MAG: UbiA prenyltransferase family protein [Phycisphaerales bacterium]|nr:UbiA prenyltransferase family protein [Phycisphaerales bacterium]